MKRTLAGGSVAAIGAVGRARPAAAAARDPAQLPGRRPCPVLAGGHRPRAAAVHRRRQRRGAALQPRPAPVGVRLGQAGEQLLRLRHRQRPRAQRRQRRSSTTARSAGAARPTARRARRRACRPRRSSGGPRGRRHAFRPDVGREHLRDELRLAVGATPSRRSTGAPRGRLPAQHRRGRRLAVPPQRRRPGLPDRDGVLRLPRRATAGSTCPG